MLRPLSAKLQIAALNYLDLELGSLHGSLNSLPLEPEGQHEC